MIISILKKITSTRVRSFSIALLLGVSLLGSFALPLVHVSAKEDTPTASSGDLFECGVTDLSGCVLVVFDVVIYQTANYALLLAGGFFNALVSFSLDSDAVDTGFANQGWAISRDIANIGFIFILLYIALRKILQSGDYALQSIITKLIIIALLVNFSLFFTKVVIDASNIFALGFYNNISHQELTVDGIPTGKTGISYGLVNAIQLQRTVGVESLEKWGDGGAGVLSFMLVILVSGIVTWIVAYALFVAGLLFLSRVVALWFLMIAAPFAFLSWILPKTENYMGQWWTSLLHNAFLAPLFLFFLFLMVKFAVVGDSILTEGRNTVNLETLDDILLGVVMRAAIFVAVLLYAVNITKSFSNQMATSIVKRGAGGIVGGAGGFALRRTFGAGASLLARSERIKRWAAQTDEDGNELTGAGARIAGVSARFGLKATQKVATSSFDVRATKVGSEELGGKARGAGGQEAILEKQIKAKEEFGKTLGKDKQAAYGKAIRDPLPFANIPFVGGVFSYVTRKNKAAGAKILLAEAEKKKKKIKDSRIKDDAKIKILERKERSGSLDVIEEMPVLNNLRRKRDDVLKREKEIDALDEDIKRYTRESTTISRGKKEGSKKDDDVKDDDVKDDDDVKETA